MMDRLNNYVPDQKHTLTLVDEYYMIIYEYIQVTTQLGK